MKKNILIYTTALVLLIIVFVNIGNTYKKLLTYTALTDRYNTVHSNFQKLSRQINNAAILVIDTSVTTEPNKISKLFFSDGQTIKQQLHLLSTTIRDSENIQTVKELKPIVINELLWILKSNVPDSMIHNKSFQHVTAFQQIDSLIAKGIKRTSLLINTGNIEVAATLKATRIWMMIFISFSGILLVFTTYNFFTQISKRKTKEAELQISNQLLKNATAQQALLASIITSSEDAIISKMLDGTITSWNPGAEKIFGYTEEEMIGDSIYVIVPRTQKHEETQMMALIKKGEYVEHYETERLRKDGKYLTVSLKVSPLLDANGNITGASIIARDITQRKKTEEDILLLNTELDQMVVERTKELIQAKNELSEALERSSFLASIAENIYDPIISSDNNNEITNWNKAAENLFEWKSEEVLGRTITDIINVIYRNDDMDQMLESFAEKGSWQGELICRTKSGKPVDVLVTASMLKDGEGNVMGSIVTGRDISDRIIAEKKLQEFEHFFNNSNDLSCIANKEGYFEIINRNFKEVFGYTNNELSESPFLDFVHPEDIPGTLQAYDKLKEGALVISFLNRYRKHDGTYLWLEWNSTPNPVTGKIYCIARDITDRKKAEDALSKLNEELEQRIKERTIDLERSEAFSRGVLNSLSAHIAVLNGSGKIVSTNQAWEKFAIENGDTTLRRTGVGSSYYAVCESDIQNNITRDVLQGIKDVMDQKIPDFYLEYPCHSPEMERWFGIRVTKFDTDEPMVVVAHQDITERRMIEEKIKESEYSYRSLIEQASDTILILGPDLKYLDINTSGCKLTGYSREEFLSLSPQSLSFSEDLTQNSVEKNKLKKGKAIIYEKKLKRKDGSALPVEISGKMMEDERIIIFARDITERKQAEAHLKELNAELKTSEKRFSNLFHLSPQPMWVIEPGTYKFIQVNKAAIDLYGYSEKEFLSMTLLDIKPTDDNVEVKEFIHNENPNNALIKEFKHIKRSGEPIAVEIYSTSIIINDKPFISVIIIDVTEKNLYEHKLLKAIIKTQEDERYEIGGELHDNVCQLLATSQLTMGMLKDAIPAEKIAFFDQGKQYITMALDEIRNLSHRLAPAFFNESTLEEAFERLFNSFNLSRKYKIVLNFDEKLKTDPVNLDIQLNIYRILQEQLRNILRYAKASLITVSVSIQNNMLTMEIVDNGIGFNVDLIKKGIGMANMKRRAELFSGKFEVISSPGNGCKITIAIPLIN